MSKHYGDFPASHTAVCMVFDSFAASSGGASAATTNFAAADVLIYKDGSATARSSANGITVTTSFNSKTGLQMVVIDLSDNTDAGFYAVGHEYQVAVADVTIDAQTVRFWLGTFSIERANGILALLKATGSVKVDAVKWNGTTVSTPATAGIPDVNVKNIDNDAASASGTVTFPNATLASQTNITAGTIATVTNQLTAAQIATGVWQDAVAGDFTAANSIGKSVMNGVSLGTGLTVNDITTKTGYSLSQSFPSNFSSFSIDASGRVDVIKVAGVAQTAGDIIGDTNDIQTRLPAALVSGRMDSSIGAVATGVIAAASFAANALDAVWSTTTRLLSAGTNIVLAKGTGITGFNDIAAGAAMTLTAAYDAAKTAATQASVDDLPTNAELATSQAAADDATLAAIAALNNLSAAQVNAEVDTALADYDGPTHAELTTALAGADDATLAAIAALSIPSASAIADAVEGRTLDVNIAEVNGLAVTGTGTSGDPWGPA